MRCLVPITSTLRVSRLAVIALAILVATGCRSQPAQPTGAPATCVARPVARDAFARDVELLKSTDFVDRSRAAERLVAAGERAVPVLGAAGEGTVRVLGTQEVTTTAPVLRTILADLEVDRLVGHLDSPWPVVRRETAAELGRRGRWSAVPYLIPHMDDDDAQVRAASASSLRRLTNRFFGFDANGALHARRRATERWREWWSVEGRVRAVRDGGDGAG